MASFVTLNEVKLWLSIESTNTNNDTLLTSLISSASSWVENWVNRTLSSTSYTERYNGTGNYSMMVKNYPITAISSLTVNGAIVSASDGVSVGYVYDNNQIIFIGNKIAKGIQNVAITYTAGYAAIPQDIKQVVIELVGYKFKEMNRIGLESKTIAGEVTTFSLKDLKEHNKNLLNNYNKVIPV